jgi:hypothetical protein
MPLYLPAPAADPRGSDGRGWNRLAILSIAGDECALRPRTYAALVESQDTRRARYGGFGPCSRQGACDGCPVLAAPARQLRAFTDQILVRIHPHDGWLYLMNHPDRDWASFAYRWTWDQVARVSGWTIGDRHVDEHSHGFWLMRADPDRVAHGWQDPTMGLAQIATSQRMEFSGEGLTFAVTYAEETARGDDGRLVPGRTVGEFVVTHPGGRTETVHVGPDPGAKAYHAEQLARAITGAIFRAKYRRMAGE